MLTCCPECNLKFETDDSLFGHEIDCDGCQSKFKAKWHIEQRSSKTIDISEDAESAEDNDDKNIKEKKRKSSKEVMVEKVSFIEKGIREILPNISDAIERNENESGTKFILDRIFQNVLGYKLEDIKAEQKIEGRKADYVLSVKGKDALVVEAKRINLPLKDKQIFQATSYGAYSGIKWALLTNVAVWKLYRITITEKVEADPVFTVDLRQSVDDAGIQYFFLISKYGLSRKDLLEKLWQKVNALSNDNLINAILSDGVVSKIKSILIKETGCKLTNEEVSSAIEKDLFQLD